MMKTSALRLCVGALLACGATLAACHHDEDARPTVPSSLLDDHPHAATVQTAQAETVGRDGGVGPGTVPGAMADSGVGPSSTPGAARDAGPSGAPGAGDAGPGAPRATPANPATPGTPAHPTTPGTTPPPSPTPNPTPGPSPTPPAPPSTH